MTIVTITYADDIVILTEREEELQSLLDIVDHWCWKWRLSVNQGKTEVIHFRKQGVSRSTFNFNVEVKPLCYTNIYKYLGFTLDEHLQFREGINTLADTAGRALGSIISKMKNCKDLSYTTFSMLYDAWVSPILLYAAGVWGGKELSRVNATQNQAMRCFLGVHKFTPVLALQGDMGWEPCLIKQKGEMLRLWNRLSSMPEVRIAKKVFNWDKAHNYPWCREMNAIFNETDQQHVFTNGLRCNTQSVKHILFREYKEKWANDIWHKQQLKTYRLLKYVYSPEPYVTLPLDRSRRSLCAQLRTGILPLAIEIGRFYSVPEEERLRSVCDLNVVEDELHFLFYCPLGDEARQILFQKMQDVKSELFWTEDEVKLEWFFREEAFSVATFIKSAWKLRKNKLFGCF